MQEIELLTEITGQNETKKKVNEIKLKLFKNKLFDKSVIIIFLFFNKFKQVFLTPKNMQMLVENMKEMCFQTP